MPHGVEAWGAAAGPAPRCRGLGRRGGAYPLRMQLVVDDLLCPTCSGYVHLFLERCPACGTERRGRFEEAIAAGPLGARALLVDEATRRAAHFVVLRYSLRSRSVDPLADIDAAFRIVAGSVTYRASVAADGPTAVLPAGPATLDVASVLLVDGSLDVRGGPSGRAIATVPLDSVLAATPILKGIPAAEAWAGATLGSRRILERRPLPGGDLLVTFSTPGSAGQLSLGNRHGLLAPTARPDHYQALARWIGILGAAAAEARWTATGPAAYASELGLGEAGGGPADTGAAEPVRPGMGEPSPPHRDAGATADERSPRSTGVRAALEELEELRAAGLVTPPEYDAKRREILARL